ncbi:MAG TPA: M56 family metallopeptidase [Parachlamydiaceae bacterium]|nr:M56 family metallopeptidase [Parachlamydiaceae bacterium]
MTSNPLYFLSFLTSSFLAFFVVALAIEMILPLFQIKNFRTRSTLRLLPFISLFIDVLFKNYSITTLINPFMCTSCSQKLYLENFQPQLKAYLSVNNTSLMRYLGTDYQHHLFTILMISLAGVSLYFVVRQLIQAYFLTKSIRSIRKNSTICNRPIHSIQLARMLNKYKVRIYISKEILIPLAYIKNVIIIPLSTMEILSQQEFEAVIAHEFEHVKYNDSLVRLFYRCTAILFWWVPTESWIKKIEQEQELACDQNVLSYDLKKESIASALLKVTKQIRNVQQIKNGSVCYLLNETNPTKARIKAILGLNAQDSEKISTLNFIWATVSLFFLLICLI